MSKERVFILPTELLKYQQTEETNTIVLQSTNRIIAGELNTNYVLFDTEGNFYVWRVPKENPQVLSQIQIEMEQTGFLSLGGTYRFRTVLAQVNFMRNTAQLGLKSLVALYTDGSGILVPYLPGASFDTYLKDGRSEAITRVLDNVLNAHQLGIVYGDRWVKNTIITPDEDVVEVDFDIELAGNYAKEFEISQLVYHIIHFAKDRFVILRYLNDYFETHRSINTYDTQAIALFMRNYIMYFQGRDYEGIQSMDLSLLKDILPLVQSLK